MCCYANVNAQAIEVKTKGKVVSAGTSTSNVAKTNTVTTNRQILQKTVKGIKDPAVQGCGSCGIKGKQRLVATHKQ
ncbi:hypothetical protein ACNQGB_18360 [Flavobacterium sp. XS1P32]|uniref:hypothetical protein n=1 Tax=unclassified Flavobacterium TaxID=196869 RepID=UPI003AAD5A01